jgi:hypothetical protein
MDGRVDTESGWMELAEYEPSMMDDRACFPDHLILDNSSRRSLAPRALFVPCCSYPQFSVDETVRKGRQAMESSSWDALYQ